MQATGKKTFTSILFCCRTEPLKQQMHNGKHRHCISEEHRPSPADWAVTNAKPIQFKGESYFNFVVYDVKSFAINVYNEGKLQQNNSRHNCSRTVHAEIDPLVRDFAPYKWLKVAAEL